MKTFTAVLAALLATAALAQEDPAAWGLEPLMRELAQVKSARARFSEVRKIPSLDMTSHSSGTLAFTAPDRLERRTLKPGEQRSVVEGERLVLEVEIEPGRRTRREFALTELPTLRPFFLALRATLAGDLDTLRSHFSVSLNGTETDWRLRLLPNEAALGNRIREIALNGRGNQVLGIFVQERNGDSTRTALTPEGPDPAAPAAETPPEPRAAPAPAD
jgi:outer membrane lipoprotein-sorting protein